MIDLRKRFLNNSSELIRRGIHPNVLLSGCQRKTLPSFKFTNSNGDTSSGDNRLTLCMKMGMSETKYCDFFYPYTKGDNLYVKEFLTNSGKGLLLAGAEGLLFVDIMNPERNKEILRSILSNMVTAWGVEWYRMEFKNDLAGFVWGFSDKKPPIIKEGMSVGLVNRPGGLMPVKALYRALNGLAEYFEKRGITINDLLKLSEETFNRATKVLNLTGNVLPINITRLGTTNIRDLLSNLGYPLEIRIPSPWYEDIMEIISPVINDPLQSELMILLIGERREVEYALEEAEKQGFPSFLVGHTLEKGRESKILR
ncbi:hypothetical protein V6M85_06930 [Sulfolobus tengchongensis]|uniref:Uncharacterized protein n=1 Tax=Sulfolobus tengchongensis TaxID=207809 RepID=A0AAX4KWH6_9CREN